MVKINLGELSAPIEALRPALDEAYKRLDEKWQEITTCLKSLPIPCNVSYKYCGGDQYAPADYSCLVWRKWNGKKRICIEHNFFNPNLEYSGSDFEVTTIPYEEWSGEMRIEMLEHVPGLFAAAAEETKEFIAKTQD